MAFIGGQVNLHNFTQGFLKLLRNKAEVQFGEVSMKTYVLLMGSYDCYSMPDALMWQMF